MKEQTNTIKASKNSIIRLTNYYNVLCRLKLLGFIRVFSDNLADAVGVTAFQVRKDFSLFGISGNKKGGYLVDELAKQLATILGKDEVHKVIVVGAGNIGQALMNYQGFAKEGIEIVAGFDIDPSRINRQAPIPILPLEELKQFVKDHNVVIGIIAVPDIAAQQVFDMMLAAGIRGVLNFAPIQLRNQGNCIVDNVNLRFELETVIYYTRMVGQK